MIARSDCWAAVEIDQVGRRTVSDANCTTTAIAGVVVTTAGVAVVR